MRGSKSYTARLQRLAIVALVNVDPDEAKGSVIQEYLVLQTTRLENPAEQNDALRRIRELAAESPAAIPGIRHEYNGYPVQFRWQR